MEADSPRWTGVYPATLTFFTEDGEFDADGTAAHLDRLINQGAHGLVVGGTSGEFIALSVDERRALIDTAVAATSGRVPLILGTGLYTTRESVKLTSYAADAGADGAVVVQPYFQRPNAAEIMDHYRAVGRVGLPLMVYNIPANSAAAPVSVTDLKRLHGERVVHAVKSTLPAVHVIHELRAEIDDSFRVFYGGVASPLEALAVGAHAWVSGALNVALPDALALWDAVDSSDIARARSAAKPILRLRKILTDPGLGEAGDLAVYRAILRIQGRPAGFCRAPLQDLSPDQHARLEALLAAA